MKVNIYRENRVIGTLSVNEQDQLEVEGDEEVTELIASLLRGTKSLTNIEFANELPKRLKSYINAQIEK